MKEKIKKIVKLPDSSNTGNGKKINWYHVYLQEPGFGVEPKGALIEEREVDGGANYFVKPLGFSNSSNMFFATPSLHSQQNESADFFKWISTLDQKEIHNLVHGRSLLMG